MIEYKILDAVLANEEGTALVIFTAEAGAILVSQPDQPELFEEITKSNPPKAFTKPELIEEAKVE